MRIVIEKHLRSEICRALISYFFKISKEINVLNHFTSSDKCLGDERDNILHLKGEVRRRNRHAWIIIQIVQRTLHYANVFIE